MLSTARRSAAIACACAAAAAAGCGSVRATGQSGAVTVTGSARAHGAGAGAGPRAPARGKPRASAAAVLEESWTEFGYNPQRTDVGPADTGITAQNLTALRTRVVHLPGTVDSSPIELAGLRVHGRTRDVIVVTTTYGRTLALDAATGATLWAYTPSDIASYQGSAQITTATPIADPDRRYVYSATPDGFVHKLSLLTGRQILSAHWPVRVTFDPAHEKIASAPNISGQDLIVVTGGYYGDAPPYDGHVVLIDRASGRITHVWNSLCSDRRELIAADTCSAATVRGDNAIWARAGAVVEPGSGRILVATGNGAFNGSTNWGDSVLELSPTLGLLHSWTPIDEARLQATDGDVGSTAPALLGTVDGRRLAVQGGKAGVLSLLDLDDLDGTTGGASPRLGGELENLSTPGGTEVLTAPAVAREAGRTWVFVGDDSSTAAYVVAGGSQPRLNLAWEHSTAGTSPILAGGLLYVYDPSGGRLIVYRPTTGQTLDTLPAAPGHWNSPIIVGGRIVLPEGNANDHASTGTLVIYHLAGR
ncbi:MAG TPA: PQQ-binding-like beta-propeller repeat protein [Solirubrobacteraceae bacterium]|nr:PQQ-binding-like beta-propeller repeat protein [Solirubrobacteraceae bacterium]